MDQAFVAHYSDGTKHDVLAWREHDGAALVVDPHAGRLVAASEYVTPQGGGFERLWLSRFPALAVIPAPGWRARRQGDDGPEEAPVIAFTVNNQSEALPIIAWPGVPEGEAYPLDEIQLIPPGGE